MRGFLQYWTESSIIFSSQEGTVWKNKKSKKSIESFAENKHIAYLICEYFPVTWANDSVENYADLLTIGLRNVDGQEFDSKKTEFYDQWRKSIWWHHGRFVQIKNTRVWETQVRIGILRPGDSSEENRMWLSQTKNYGEEKYRAEFSRIDNFEVRNENYERNVVIKDQILTQIVQRIFGNYWQWEINCSKRDSCSFRHDMDKRAKMTQSNPFPKLFLRQNERNASKTPNSQSKRVFVVECFDDHTKITSKEMTSIHSVKVAPSKMLVHKSESGCRFVEKCSYTHRQIDEQLSIKSKKDGDKSAVTMLKKKSNTIVRWNTLYTIRQINDNWIFVPR